MWKPIQQLAETVLGPEIRRMRRESIQAVERERVILEATVQDLQRELIDRRGRDYLVIGGESGETAFSRDSIGRVVANARALVLKNPLAQRAVDVMAQYCFGQGVTIEAEADADKPILEKFMKDPRNRAELFGSEGLEFGERELSTTGNLFVMLYGRAAGPGVPQVRVSPVEEIREIIANPDDRREPQFYLREVTRPNGSSEKAYHPDWLYTPTDRPDEINGTKVRWDVPISHYAVGGFIHWQWGLPKFYASGDWAISYKSFLEDLATVIRGLSRYAHTLTVKSSPGKVAAAAVALRSSHVGGLAGGPDTNPPPAAGSTFVQGESTKLEAFKAAGMHVDADSGRRMLLMFAAGMGLPETFFGDLSQSNLATAKALDRPTELTFLQRQELWGRILSDIGGWAIAQSRGAGAVRLDMELPKVTVEFPPVLEHDVDAAVKSTIAALTLDGKAVASVFKGAERDVAKMLLNALGVTETAELLDRIEQAGGFDIEDEPEPPDNDGDVPPQFATEARIVRAFEAIRKRMESEVAA
jgi:hypothetical protein